MKEMKKEDLKYKFNKETFTEEILKIISEKGDEKDKFGKTSLLIVRYGGRFNRLVKKHSQENKGKIYTKTKTLDANDCELIFKFWEVYIKDLLTGMSYKYADRLETKEDAEDDSLPW